MSEKIGGWTKHFRKIQKCCVWIDFPEPYTRREAWRYLFENANYEDKMNDENSFIVCRGQLATSISALATKWQWNRDKVRAFLKYLEKNEMIIYSIGYNGAIISVINYEKYQGDLRAENEQKNTKKKV